MIKDLIVIKQLPQIEEHLKEINDSEEDYEGLVKILKDELVTTEQIFDAYDKYTQPKNKEFVKTK